MRHPRTRSLVGLILIALLAACGTTVNHRSAGGGLGGGAGTNGGGAAGATANGGSDTGGTGGTGPASSATGGGVSSSQGSGASVGLGSSATDSSANTSVGIAPNGERVVEGPGVTRTSVSVGVQYTTNGDAANAALGAGKITQGNEQADDQAVIDDINAHGGVAGRKLVPVWVARNAQSTDTYASQDQAACASLTQDHKVLGVMGGGLTNNFDGCVQKAGAIEIVSGEIISPDQGFFNQFPDYINAGTMSQDRMMAAYVAALVRLRYFTSWDANAGASSPTATKAKIGILSVDVPEWNRPLDHVFLPRLAQAGFGVDPGDVIRLTNPSSTAQDSVLVSQVQNATLKFRQDGVDHVILLDANGSLLLLFGSDARSQHYYPRYGVNSAAGIQALFDAGVTDANQLRGAEGLGWLPNLDLPAGSGTKYQTAAAKHCLTMIEQKTGQSFTSTNAQGIALGACDNLYLFADAVNRAGPSLTQATLRQAIEGLGGSFATAQLESAFFSPTRHDAAEIGHDLRWDSGCSCAGYVGGPYKIP